MSKTLVTAPTVEPVSLAEAKDHLNYEEAEDDALISAFIAGAREYVEKFLNRKLVQQTWRWQFDAFPRCDYFELPINPVQAVNSITYTGGGVSPNQQTLSADVYGVDTGVTPARVYLKYGQSWPANRGHYNDVAVEFVAGYAPAGSPQDVAAGVPESIRIAIKMLVADMYQHREASKEVAHFHNPTIDALLGPHRLYTL